MPVKVCGADTDTETGTDTNTEIDTGTDTETGTETETETETDIDTIVDTRNRYNHYASGFHWSKTCQTSHQHFAYTDTFT